MKYVYILVSVGIMLFSSIATANIENINGNGNGPNGIISINIDKNYPLFYNVKSAQITIVRVENNIEKVVWGNTIDMPFTLSFSVAPGTYKIYVQKDESTVIEFNDDSTGYLVTPKSKINIGSDTIDAVPMYINGIFTDVFSDLPWRINPGENIPITYVVKDANQWSLYIRDIFIYNDGAPIGNEVGDTLVYTHPLQKRFVEKIWYDHDSLSPSIFDILNNNVTIHVKFDIDWAFDVHNFYMVHTSQYKLPSLKNWSYGDTHYHSNYTDNVYEFGAPIEPTKITGKAIGLDWVTVTDHSFDLDPNRWIGLVNDSKKYSTNSFRILPSEEISCTVPSFPQQYNHYLAYNLTTFVPGGEWEDGTGSHYNCSQLVSIVNRQKGFGYPAHPMDDDIFLEPWQNYSLNFAGLQIWNGAGNFAKLEEGLNKWVGLLLKGRKIYVEAGSDAHGDFNSGYGKVRTMVLAPNNNNNEILSSLRKGQSIMTDGPVIIFNINGTIIGNTRNVISGSKINLNIQWNSTPEFGYVRHIKIIKGKIGGIETIEQDIVLDSYSGKYKKTLTATQDLYFRLEANTSNGKRAYTNPIWINVP